jgi:hypothetical protein
MKKILFDFLKGAGLEPNRIPKEIKVKYDE